MPEPENGHNIALHAPSLDFAWIYRTVLVHIRIFELTSFYFVKKTNFNVSRYILHLLLFFSQKIFHV